MRLSILTKKKVKRKKAQVWSLDLAVALVIFLVALFMFYKYSINSIYTEKYNMNDLLLDGKLISSYLVSEGYPIDWDSSNVTLIGLTDGRNKLIQEKVEDFSTITSSDYHNSRKLLSTTHDYYVYFENENGGLVSVGSVEGIGKDYVAEDPDNLIKIVRFVLYNSEIIKMVVLVW